MSDITLSAGIRSNLLALQSTAELQARTQGRLATGKKVNSALDNPINFFTASALTARASDLGNLLDSVSNAIQTLNAANNGITSLTKLVQNAQAIVQQAQQSAATTATYTGTVSGLTTASSFSVTSGNTIIIGDGVNTTTITLGATETVQQIITAVNGGTAAVKAELSSDGKLLLEATGAGQVTIAGSASIADEAQFGLTKGASVAAGTVNSTRSSLASQYDAIRTQIDQLAADSGFNGVNLLNGDSLKVVFNEKNTSSLSISGVTYNSAGLGVSASTNTFQTNSDINTALGNLTSALNSLRSQAASFGSSLSVVQIRQDFTKATINTLQTGSDNLTLADTNEEGANLLALQTRQQLSTTALSLAAQASNSVLKLFG
jgi:flagellin-like hook-associated protein FlgL